MERSIEIAGTVLFAIAILHTFSIKFFQNISHRYRKGSVPNRFFHLIGEVEIVFGFWAGLFLGVITLLHGFKASVFYLDRLNFTEPAFIFVIMTMAGTRPVVFSASALIRMISKLVPLSPRAAFYLTTLTVGPLLGSFITEPAAMTVTALILKEEYFDAKCPKNFLYLSLAVLFVNISIGGVLTNFAAPPVLMVAGTWNWGIIHMLTHFGWKAAIAVLANAAIITWIFRKHLKGSVDILKKKKVVKIPVWVTAVHLGFLGVVVATAHYPVVFVGFFLFFLGLTTITEEHHEILKIKESLLVAFFLGGLVVLGGTQGWWLSPLLLSLSTFPLFVGTTFLTAFMDNAALTYLGAQVPGIADASKYALVAGAVSGGGLSVIANAPNPAGFVILGSSFGEDGINPIGLFLSALPFTFIAMACFWLLPGI